MLNRPFERSMPDPLLLACDPGPILQDGRAVELGSTADLGIAVRSVLQVARRDVMRKR